jgi:HNH endonuclease
MEPSESCRIWPYAKAKGYGIVEVRGVTILVHGLTCEVWHGPRPAGMQAAHSCGENSCWAGEHLRWTTAKDNCGDKLGHGRLARGESIGASKLSEADVRAIRLRHTAGESQRSLAREYNVTHPVVSRIVRRKAWAWLD